MRKLILGLLLMLGATAATAATAFDHSHTAWDSLLRKHVVLTQDGNASQVRYAGMLSDRKLLQAYLESVSNVTEADYRSWPKARQLAFLVNSYNAWTLDLVLGRYPDLKSIKDLGSVFQSPWKRKFFILETAVAGVQNG